MSWRDLLKLKSRPAASGETNEILTVASEADRTALLNFIQKRDEWHNARLLETINALNLALANWWWNFHNERLSAFCQEVNAKLPPIILARDQLVAAQAAAAALKDAIRGIPATPQTKTIKIQRDGSEKITGAVVLSV